MTPDKPSIPTPEEFAAWRLTHPPMMGADDGTVEAAPGSPDTPEATVDEPAEPTVEDVASDTEPEDAPAPEETDAPDDANVESFTDLDPETLPEELREPYQQMRADYTRKTMALAEERRALEGTAAFAAALVADTPDEEQTEVQEAAFRALGERLGYVIEDDGSEDADADVGDQPEGEPEFRDPRVDALIAEREQAAQAAADAEFEATLDAEEQRIESELQGLAKAEGIEKLTDDELDLLFDAVLALPPVDGGPDVKGAYKRLSGVLNVAKERWVQSKQADTAPDGSPAVDKPDLSTSEGRVAHAARAAAAAMRD